MRQLSATSKPPTSGPSSMPPIDGPARAGATLLLILYKCGERVSEVTGLLWDDLQLMPPRQVRLEAKGRTERLVPIWSQTADALRRLRDMT